MSASSDTHISICNHTYANFFITQFIFITTTIISLVILCIMLRYFPLCLWLHLIVLSNPTESLLFILFFCLCPTLVYSEQFVFKSLLDMPSLSLSVLLCKCIKTGEKKKGFRCSRCGSATTSITQMKNESFSSLSTFFLCLPGFFSSLRVQLAPSLHPKGELQRPLLSLCLAHYFHFPWLCLSFMLLTFPHSSALSWASSIFPVASSKTSPPRDWQIFFDEYFYHGMRAELFPLDCIIVWNAGAAETTC